MTSIASDQIYAFLRILSERYPHAARLTLLGGSALCLLGSDRPTLDIDYVGDDLRKTDFQHLIEQVAQELQIALEAVPIEQFVPIPAGADERRLFIGRFHQLDVYVLDPYTIALSKLDRGFDTDLEDVAFLIRRGIVAADELEQVVSDAATLAQEFAMDAAALHVHLATVQGMVQ
ncbi:MAG: hypothetical protein KDD75_23750 [Caldilineaceae bacterium]|nr:hypothetical protein [Caldilineaceae bacterium]